ncbi:MAG: carbamoyltransferase HypF [Dethiosulfovibrio peptidovorans]|nr:MAG: carbamoyltransferase HypF [Dethiosulfovibrio peptidovorans]
MMEKRILVTGVVQGVGFRPFCARLASSFGLGGSVINSSDGVEIVLRGPAQAIDHYIRELPHRKPNPADIHDVRILSEGECAEAGPFVIEASRRSNRQRVLIPPDIATCDRCLKEMNDPTDRRYRYPFINCTDCGPRFSIVRGLPYDRHLTTMAIFPMCPDCAEEYGDQVNRRYHAQPNACPVCGPSVIFQGPDGSTAQNENAIQDCREALKAGFIVAIKGLGGFHLACSPWFESPLKVLRNRKRRPHKPLAIMAESLEIARELVTLTETTQRLLISPQRPIVVCNRRPDSALHELVAPRQSSVGVMLPYTPLHHLLLQDMKALVMTSANIADAPLISDNDRALTELKGIADAFLLHDRDIHMKVDDSLVAEAEERTVLLRRGRGYVPNPLSVSFLMPPILAAGAEMKSTFTLTQDNLAFPSQYLGDGKQMETLEYYREALNHFTGLYNIHPKFLVHDSHPLYLSTRVARSYIGEPEQSMAVQHHHAHLAACLAEYDRNQPTIGVILDGTGYGDDGTIWGGEFLVGDWSGFRRMGFLRPAPLPGGDRAILEPWRYGLSLLNQTLGPKGALREASKLWPEKADAIRTILKTIKSSPLTSSCGRLFDGISALLGGPLQVSYDGQAAMELEAVAQDEGGKMNMALTKRGDLLSLDWGTLIPWILRERPTLEQGSSVFHEALAQGILRVCRSIRQTESLSMVALSGGVWQNRRLLARSITLLEADGFQVLTHKSFSPNDESVSLGQAIIAGWAWRN